MMKMKSIFKKHKIKVTVLIATIAMSIDFVLMQLSTVPVVQEIYDAFYSTDYYVPASSSKYYSDKDIDDYNIVFIDDDDFNNNIKAHFNELHEYNNDNYTIDLEVKSVYSIHNFKSGCIWIKYSFDVLDNTGNTVAGSKDVPVKLTIKKHNSNWEVVEIDEKEAYSNSKDFLRFWFTLATLKSRFYSNPMK